MGAGDWADALVGRLGTHADGLHPLAGHQAETALAEAGRVSEGAQALPWTGWAGWGGRRADSECPAWEQLSRPG
jgi:hypothetical protein